MALLPLRAARSEADFGGKAVRLGHALRRGLPVPPGFALDAELVAAVAARRPDAVDAVSGAIDALGPGPVAVRSSAVGEDGAAASFAGQHATVLGVRDAAGLADAIERVWQSAHGDAALAYRKRLGIDGAPRMGVVVQKLVDADAAGVLFTRNPLTGADERVIEAAWGLGEVVVAGLVTPDRYRMSRDGRVLERAVGEKDLAIRLAPDGGTREVEVPAGQVRAPCLDDGALARLGRLAAACEDGARAAVDLEWALAGEQLFLLQERDVTRGR